MTTAFLPRGSGPASPSMVKMAPSGQTWATIPIWTEVAVDEGPVPKSTASPGSGVVAAERPGPGRRPTRRRCR